MEFKFKPYKVSELDKNMRTTVHKTGKMGFTYEAAKKLRLESVRSADIGVNEANLEDDNLYLALYPEEGKGDFKVVKAGAYFYINTKILLDNLKMDYVNDTISFDIVSQDFEGTKFYALKRRPPNKKDKEETGGNDLLETA
jgi:Fe-S cluster assembly iron-binding protein IscA